MPELKTIASLPKRFIDLSNRPCQRQIQIERAMRESQKATKQ